MGLLQLCRRLEAIRRAKPPHLPNAGGNSVFVAEMMFRNPDAVRTKAPAAVGAVISLVSCVVRLLYGRQGALYKSPKRPGQVAC